MALVAAVMSSTLAGYLEKTVKIEASCQDYARALVDRGYETPELFHTLSSRDLLTSFAWAPEHVNQVVGSVCARLLITLPGHRQHSIV